MHESDLPATPGTYVLIISARPGVVRVGKLGELALTEQPHLYVGSAHGPGGLRARVGRHLRSAHGKAGRHWHIDHLLAVARIREVWLVTGTEKLECAWAAALAACDACETPLPGFGASDCRCPSHLLQGASWDCLARLRRRLPRRPEADRTRLTRLT
jgi:Uri superfamily endonuclease